MAKPKAVVESIAYSIYKWHSSTTLSRTAWRTQPAAVWRRRGGRGATTIIRLLKPPAWGRVSVERDDADLVVEYQPPTNQSSKRWAEFFFTATARFLISAISVVDYLRCIKKRLVDRTQRRNKRLDGRPRRRGDKNHEPTTIDSIYNPVRTEPAMRYIDRTDACSLDWLYGVYALPTVQTVNAVAALFSRRWRGVERIRISLQT